MLNTDVLWLVAELVEPNPAVYCRLASVCHDAYRIFTSDKLWSRVDPYGVKVDIYRHFQKTCTDADRGLIRLFWEKMENKSAGHKFDRIFSESWLRSNLYVFAGAVAKKGADNDCFQNSGFDPVFESLSFAKCVAYTNPSIYGLVTEEIRSNPQFYELCWTEIAKYTEHIPQDFLEDKEFVLEVLRNTKDGQNVRKLFDRVTPDIQKDPDLIAAIAPANHAYIADRLDYEGPVMSAECLLALLKSGMRWVLDSFPEILNDPAFIHACAWQSFENSVYLESAKTDLFIDYSNLQLAALTFKYLWKCDWVFDRMRYTPWNSLRMPSRMVAVFELEKLLKDHGSPIFPGTDFEAPKIVMNALAAGVIPDSLEPLHPDVRFRKQVVMAAIKVNNLIFNELPIEMKFDIDILGMLSNAEGLEASLTELSSTSLMSNPNALKAALKVIKNVGMKLKAGPYFLSNMSDPEIIDLALDCTIIDRQLLIEPDTSALSNYAVFAVLERLPNLAERRSYWKEIEQGRTFSGETYNNMIKQFGELSVRKFTTKVIAARSIEVDSNYCQALPERFANDIEFACKLVALNNNAYLNMRAEVQEHEDVKEALWKLGREQVWEDLRQETEDLINFLRE